jgi:hypothetical protein
MATDLILVGIVNEPGGTAIADQHSCHRNRGNGEYRTPFQVTHTMYYAMLLGGNKVSRVNQGVQTENKGEIA